LADTVYGFAPAVAAAPEVTPGTAEPKSSTVPTEKTPG
jgi:hypothetical protein